MINQDDRRRYNRIDDQFNVRVAREVKNDGFKDMAIDIAQSVNVSASGMLLHIREPLKLKEIVRVTFLKPNTFEFFEGLARVIRVEEDKNKSYLVGMNFFNLSTVELKKLDYYLTLCAH